MRRKVEHEITLLAFAADGGLVDIIDTNRRYAYRFVSRLRRNVGGDSKPATHIVALPPGALWSGTPINRKPL